MTSLYEIEKNALEVERLLLEGSGELTPAIERFLDEVEHSLVTRVDGLSAAMDRLEDSAERYKKKASEYSEAARLMTQVRTRLKERIKETMLRLGKKEVSGEEITLALSSSSPKLVVDEATLHAESPGFLIVKTSYEVDKENIKAALLDGIEVRGARLEPVTRLLVKLKKGAV